jgi:mono/diheme cytochrome c family protein
MKRSRLGLPPHAFLLSAICSACCLSLVASPSCAQGPAKGSPKDRAKIEFATQIEPIFAQHCLKCHGGKDSQSGLRLDSLGAILKGGDRGAAVVPGNAAKSLLVKALQGEGDLTPMPAEAPRLSKETIARVVRWINEGATGPAESTVGPRPTHWAFVPVAHPRVPAMAPDDRPGNPIDAFIRQRLAFERLAPSPEADRSTLIRRLSFDLRGLPPSPDEVEEFQRDARPDGYERLVDRMLASPAYGERWGRHWLDQARYADSNGYTVDSPRQIWRYRDWVIAATNADVPFDRFALEQLAGDLLPKPTPDELVATGFHRNTLTNEEGGVDKEQFRVESVIDRVNTTGTVFLGLTVGCAQCHQHKFDPISQRDYYNLFAIFNNCDEPALQVATADQASQLKRLTREIAKAERPLVEYDRALRSRQTAWEQTIAARPPVNWETAALSTVRTEKGTQLNPVGDGSLVVDFSVPANDTYHLEFDVPSGKVDAIRLEALTHPSLPLSGPGRSDATGNFVLSEFEVNARPLAGSAIRGWMPIKLAAAVADHSQEGYPAAFAVDGDRSTGWAIGTKFGNPHIPRELMVIPRNPIRMAGGVRLKVVLRHEHSEPNYLVGCVRLSTAVGPVEALQVPNSIRGLALVPANKRTRQQRAELSAAFYETDVTRRPLGARVAVLKSQKAALDRRVPTTLVLSERKIPRDSHVLIRGDFLRLGAVVTGGVPEFLPPLPPSKERPTRIDLARWLFDPANPLTARVTVNRAWEHFFGTGLVDTENDFGTQGSRPTHPALLDWLAGELVRRGWSQKSLHRLIVTSATYRQSSELREDLIVRDPGNRWLARQSRLRLEAESVRDAALTASGLLCRKIGGPSVHPPQPEGFFVITQQKKAWPESQGADRYRRGMYTYFWRSSPYPMLPTFDAPDGNTTCTRRNRSDTPLQALTLANDRVFVEMSDGLAARILREAGGDHRAQIRRAFLVCLAREPSAAEADRLGTFLAAQTGPPSEAWRAAARVLLNLDEFITRE